MGFEIEQSIGVIMKQLDELEQRVTEMEDDLNKHINKNEIIKMNIFQRFLSWFILKSKKPKIIPPTINKPEVKIIPPTIKIPIEICLHKYEKYMGPENYGEGKFEQKYICLKCRKIKRVIQ